MFGTNMAFLVGTLGRNPDPKVFENGSEASNFTIATTDPITRETIWHRIVAKGATANICNNNLKKGSVVTITGHINYRTYRDSNTGVEKNITEIIAHRVDIMPSQSSQSNDFNAGNGFSSNKQQSGFGNTRGPRKARDNNTYQNSGNNGFNNQNNGQGYNQGRAQGYNQGRAQNYNQGHSQGYHNDYENNYQNNEPGHFQRDPQFGAHNQWKKGPEEN